MGAKLTEAQLFEKFEREAREEEELGREHLMRAHNIRSELERMRREAGRSSLTGGQDDEA